MPIPLNEELEQLGKEFVEWYGKPLPNPEHEPKQFEYLFRLFMTYRHTKTEE